MLDHKLCPPLPHHRTVARPRLTRRLDAVTEPVIVLSAPAGYGKTTLLAEWTRRSRARGDCAWLTLDRHDNSPDRLWSAIRYTLGRARPELRLPDTPGGWTADSWAETVLPALVAALTGIAPLTLVLDGVDSLTDGETLSTLGEFITRLPQGCRAVLATRHRPGAPIPWLRARGAVAEFDEADLACTPDESAALLGEGLGLRLPAGHTERLHAAAEGWPTGLCLAGRALADHGGEAGSSPGPAREPVFDYLRTEVLDRLTTEQRDLLMRTSVLDELEVGACVAVTGSGRAGTVLGELARTVRFLAPVGADGRTYRVHGALRSLLSAMLAAERPHQPERLHRAAAGWYADRGRTGAAVRHAVLGGDREAAVARVLERWEESVAVGRAGEVAQWLRLLPARTTGGDPRLCLVAAVAALAGGAPEEARRRLDVLQAHQPAEQRLGPGTTLAEAAAVAGAMTSFVRGRNAETDGLLSGTGLLTRPGPPTGWRALARVAHGTALLWQGRYAEAESRLAEATRDAYATQHTLVLIRALGSRALGAALDGRHGDAWTLSEEALRVAREEGLGDHFLTAIAHLCRSLLQVSAARPEAAERSLERAEAALAVLAGAGCEPRLRTMCWIARAMLEQARHRADAARDAVQRARRTLADCDEPGALGALLDGLACRPAAARDAAGPGTAQLSPQERRVLRALCGPLTLREIAAELYVSRNTVKTQVSAVFRKLGANSRSGAVAAARERGLL